MKFNIRDIGADGLIVSRSLAGVEVRKLLGDAGDTAGVELSTAPAELKLELELLKADPGILVQGSLGGHFGLICSRCLEPAPIFIEEKDVRLTFLPARKQAEALHLDDVETYTHDGKELDLEPAIREILILAIPLAPLCQPECKGLCAVCGADLNGEPCTCAAENKEETPWATRAARAKKIGTLP